MFGVECQPQNESSGIGDLNDLPTLHINAVNLPSLTAGVAVAVKSPGDPLHVVQTVNKD